MKKYKILTAAVAAAVLGGFSAMAQITYHPGDLLAAFGNGNSSTPGVNSDIVVDLGSYSNFLQPAASTTKTWDLSALMDSTGNLAYTINSSLYWAVIGGDISTSTIYNTLARNNPSVQTTAPGVNGVNNQNAAINNVDTVGNNTIPITGNTLIQNYTAIPNTVLVDTTVGGFSSLVQDPYSGNLGDTLSYNILHYNAGTSDLYQSTPGAGSAAFLGSFNLSSAGVLTFNPVPEPSTWAMIGSGTLALLALRRRNKI